MGVSYDIHTVNPTFAEVPKVGLSFPWSWAVFRVSDLWVWCLLIHFSIWGFVMFWRFGLRKVLGIQRQRFHGFGVSGFRVLGKEEYHKPRTRPKLTLWSPNATPSTLSLNSQP